MVIGNHEQADENTTIHRPSASLTNEEILRYSRHLIMPKVGMEGQLKLKTARVLLIGTGGLGAPVGLYLTAAGVGNTGLIDFDVVDFTNLQRQISFGTADLENRKRLRPPLEAQSRCQDHDLPNETDQGGANAFELFRGYDVIVDGTDNFATPTC